MTETAQTGVVAPAAGGQVVTPGQGTVPTGSPTGQPAAAPVTQPAGSPTGQPAGAAAPAEVKVPLSVVEALRDELKGAKTTAADLKAKMDQLNAAQKLAGMFGPSGGNVQTVNAPAQAPQAAPTVTDPLQGVADGELISAGDLRKILQVVKAQPQNDDTRAAIGNITQTLAKIQLQVQDPQYETTIRTYLPEMITANPNLIDLIGRSPNRLMAALTIAKMSPGYQAARNAAAAPATPPALPPDILSDLQKIIENASKPGSPGAMGGGGAVQGHDRFKNMTDKEFAAEVDRVKNGVQAR